MLPEAVKAWRDVRGWSQKELAARASEVARRATDNIEARVSPSTIAMIEVGDRQPSLEVLGWVADALGVKPEVIALIAPMPAVLA